ncbi:MAG: hypothetical protein RL172_1735 [Bacteroidota bacterium]|jgi:hypothetical protein
MAYILLIVNTFDDSLLFIPNEAINLIFNNFLSILGDCTISVYFYRRV